MEASTLQAPVALQRLSVPASLLRLRSDEQLVASFRGGSEDAFRAIHDRYRVRLLAYSRQMLGGSRQDAEDVLQDVFVRVYRALRASDRPVSLRAWLYRIAHNRCIDQLRSPSAPLADVFDMSHTPQPEPVAVAERREDLQRLVTDVSRLPEQQRSALLMRELQGLSYEELASSLDVTVAAVKSLLVRARSGLVDSAQARDTACEAVRGDLALACDRGVRSSGLVRRHLRDCTPCREYRDDLRGVRRRLAALVPVGPLGLLGLGSLGGGGAAAGGSVTAGVGASGVIVTATKVALVCAVAAVTAGSALGIAPKTVLRALQVPTGASPTHHRTPPPAPAVVTAAVAAAATATSSTAPATSAARPRLTYGRIHRTHPAAVLRAAATATPVAPLGGSSVPASVTTDQLDPQTGGTGATSSPSAAATTGTTGTTGPTGVAPATPIASPTPTGGGDGSASSGDSTAANGVTPTSSTGSPAPSASTSAGTAPSSSSSPSPGSGASTGLTTMNSTNDPTDPPDPASTGAAGTSGSPTPGTAGSAAGQASTSS